MQRLFLRSCSPLQPPRQLGTTRRSRCRSARREAAGRMGSTAAAGGATHTGATAAASSLWQQIVERYDAAQRNATATVIESNTEVVPDGGIQFVLRMAARLRDKPKAPGSSMKEWRNPFLPYEQALWVANLGESHVLLLNKFNIVPWHCLVVTVEFRRQEEELDADDLGATWRVMQSMPHGGLGFYNCGPFSGASQPHKHLQIVPLPLDSSDGGSSPAHPARPPIWPAVVAATSVAVAGEPVELHSLPFATFAAALDLPQSGVADVGAHLAGVYQQLMTRCRAFVEGRTGQPSVTPQDGSLSYNLVLTADFMMVVPRRAEADGPVSCNSVAFAGSIFVKSHEEQQYVKRQGPLHILAAVGYDL